MKKNLIITEKQLQIIGKMILSEKMGVPDYILDSASELYNIIEGYLKTLNTEQEEYTYDTYINLRIADFVLTELEINVKVNELDWYEGKAEMASMGVANRFRFDDAILMKVLLRDQKLELNISFVVSDGWDVSELYDKFTENRVETESILAHELKHRYDKEKKPQDLIGKDAEYQAFASSGMEFGIPVISEFMRYSYFIQHAENLVRPTEIASRMRQTNITKDQFRDFLENDMVYKELLRIKNFSFEYFINELKNQMDKVDRLLTHIGEDIGDMTDDEKIKFVLQLVYINLVNYKVDKFDEYITNAMDRIGIQLNQLFGGGFNISKQNPEKEKVRQKFINHVIKYRDREMQFFVDECERFNYISTKLLKKIGKLYDMAADKEQTNESIINWELHQKLMEKRYGKQEIVTTYKHKKK
jgi:hypothetical protein